MALSVQYSLDVIRDEAAHLVERGAVSRRQPIYCLCRCFSAQEWCYIECELERHDFLLRDCIGDLLSQTSWQED